MRRVFVLLAGLAVILAIEVRLRADGTQIAEGPATEAGTSSGNLPLDIEADVK